MSDKTDTYGPEWLDEFADRMCNNDQALEAVAFRQMASHWKRDQIDRDSAQLEASRLQSRLNAVANVATAAMPMVGETLSLGVVPERRRA